MPGRNKTHECRFGVVGSPGRYAPTAPDVEARNLLMESTHGTTQTERGVRSRTPPRPPPNARVQAPLLSTPRPHQGCLAPAAWPLRLLECALPSSRISWRARRRTATLLAVALPSLLPPSRAGTGRQAPQKRRPQVQWQQAHQRRHRQQSPRQPAGTGRGGGLARPRHTPLECAWAAVW